MEVKIEGLKELENLLADMNTEFGPKSAGQAVRPAIRNAMKPLEGTIRTNTPVDSGKLAESIKLRIRKPTKKMIAGIGGHHKETHILTGTVGYEWSKPSLWNQALAVEFGNSHSPEQAPLRRAMKAHSVSMGKNFKDELAKSIERTAKRLFKKHYG